MTQRANLVSSLTAAQGRLDTAILIRDAVKASNGAGPALVQTEKAVTKATESRDAAQAKVAAWDAMPKSKASLALWLKGKSTAQMADELAGWLNLPDEDPA